MSITIIWEYTKKRFFHSKRIPIQNISSSGQYRQRYQQHYLRSNAPVIEFGKAPLTCPLCHVLGQVRLAVEDIIRPTVGTFRRQRFLFKSAKGLRICFHEDLHLLLQGLAFERFAQSNNWWGAAHRRLLRPRGVGQTVNFPRQMLVHLVHELSTFCCTCMMRSFFGWRKDKEMVGSANLFLVDEGIVDEDVDVSNAE
jgi:hypothetical protein